jgi:hypothetical protein
MGNLSIGFSVFLVLWLTPPPFFVSADSNGDKVDCFHALLEVLILKEVRKALGEHFCKC